MTMMISDIDGDDDHTVAAVWSTLPAQVMATILEQLFPSDYIFVLRSTTRHRPPSWLVNAVEEIRNPIKRCDLHFFPLLLLPSSKVPQLELAAAASNCRNTVFVPSAIHELSCHGILP